MEETKIKKTRTKKVAATIHNCANCSLNHNFKGNVIEECILTIQRIMSDTGKTVVCGDISEWEKFKLNLMNYEHKNIE
jgi:hypothetical protein